MTSTRRRTLTAALLAPALAALLAACGGTDTPETGERSATATVSASASSAPSSAAPSTSPSAPAAPTSSSPATVKGTDMTKSVDAATRIFTTWSNRKLDYDAWWAQLEPLLSPAAQRAYANTDPANIPPLKIKGKLKELPGGVPNTTAGLATYVAIPTDKGQFKIALERTEEGAPWVMLGLEFPPSIH